MGIVNRRDEFAARLKTGDPLVGMFQKFPHHQVTEILALSGIDFAVLDAEHAPFAPGEIDACLLAGRAADLPLLVRVPHGGADAILSVLDMGAAGVFVPHVDSAAKAASIARGARYAGGGRGFSPSTRAGGYGTRGLRDYMAAADREILVVAQIEDAAAVDEIAAIAGTPGIDALFVGRADLAASLDVDWNDPTLDEVTRKVAVAAADAGIVCGAYLADPALAETYRSWGISFLLAGADQGALRAGAAAIAGRLSLKQIDRERAA